MAIPSFIVCALLLLPGAARAAAIEADLDPRVELAAVVDSLDASSAAAEGFAPGDYPYVAAARARFARFGGHPAVRAAARLAALGVDRVRRGQILAHLSPPPRLEVLVPIPYSFLETREVRRGVEAWLSGLRSFAEEADFMAFFAAERPSTDGAVRRFRASLEQVGYLGKIERYAGLPYAGSYRMLLSPFYKMGGQANSVVFRDDGSYDIETIAGPDDARGAPLDFLTTEIPSTIWHELGHGLFDTLADLHSEEIAARAGLYAGIRQGGCYGDWHQCVKEHVVRAVKIRLIALERGDAAIRQELRQEGEDHFPYLAAMIERLREYESHRKEYPTLADFYPRLLEVFPPAPAQPSPEPDVWLAARARGFSAPGQLARAIRYLDASRRPDLRKRAGLAYLAGDYASARRDAAAVLAAEPGDGEASLVLGLVAGAQGRAAEARAAFEAVEQRCAAAPGGVAAVTCREARRQLDGMAPAAAAVPAPSRPAAGAVPAAPAGEAGFESLKTRAIAAYGRGAFEEALAGLEAALRLAPSDAETHMNVGVVLQALRRWDDAERSYARAVQLAESSRSLGSEELLASILSCRASLFRQRGSPERARQDLEKALASAPADWQRRLETEQQLRELARPEPAVRASTEPLRVLFEVDPRVELFSIVYRLGAREKAGPALPVYAREADLFFAGMSGHAAVRRMARELRAGATDQVRSQAMTLLYLSPPPELAVSTPFPVGLAQLAGGAREEEAFLSDLRDFAARSRFMEFFEAHRETYAAFVQESQKEARTPPGAASVARYLRVSFDATYHFLLAPLLPRPYAGFLKTGGAGAVHEYRIRAPEAVARLPRFGFDSFGELVSHELTHTVTDALAYQHEELQAYAGAGPDGCADNWMGCVVEHVVLAVAIRTLARESGEDAAAGILKDYASRGFAHLGALCDRLREFEKAPEPQTFAAFYPRLVSVFRERLIAQVREKAAAKPPKAEPGEDKNALGVLAFQKGDFAGAAALFKSAVAEDPLRVEAFLNCGVAYEKAGDRDSAMGCYDEGIRVGRIAPSAVTPGVLSDALSSRATLLQSLHRADQARSDLQEALKFAPEGWGHEEDARRRLAALGDR